MRYRSSLPQLSSAPFVTDGGIETHLIFNDGLELPLFASFVLLRDETGADALRRYFRPYLDLAARRGTGIVLESPTWRSSADWGEQLGYDSTALADANRTAIALLEELRSEYEDRIDHIVISGCIGPRGDGYAPEAQLDADDAAEYHTAQVGAFAETAADMVTAITMTHDGEAIGITRAAQAAGLPVAISFTVETDGRLPSGQPLGEAITSVDRATGSAPAYYMVNCAHPTHFVDVIRDAGDWRARIAGIRANASTKSHAELDEADELDEGDPDELAAGYVELQGLLPGLAVVGGCCGTDVRHVTAIAEALGKRG